MQWCETAPICDPIAVADASVPSTIADTPAVTAKAGREYRYPVVAADADSDALSYTLSSAPAGMTIDVNGLIRWTPSAAGSVAATVRVADALSYVEQSWSIDVVAADVPLAAIVGITPDPVPLGSPFTITVLIAGAAGPTTVIATLDGQPIALDADGSTERTAPSENGTHVLVITVSDGYDTSTTEQTFTVGEQADTTPPTVTLVTPAEHPDWDTTEITAPTPVTGLVTGADVSRWVLAVQARGSSDWRTLADGNSEFAEREIAYFGDRDRSFRSIVTDQQGLLCCSGIVDPSVTMGRS